MMSTSTPGIALELELVDALALKRAECRNLDGHGLPLRNALAQRSSSFSSGPATPALDLFRPAAECAPNGLEERIERNWPETPRHGPRCRPRRRRFARHGRSRAQRPAGRAPGHRRKGRGGDRRTGFPARSVGLASGPGPRPARAFLHSRWLQRIHGQPCRCRQPPRPARRWPTACISKRAVSRRWMPMRWPARSMRSTRVDCDCAVIVAGEDAVGAGAPSIAPHGAASW